MAHAFFLGVDVADDASDTPGAVTLSVVEKEETNGTATYRLDHITHETETPDTDDLADRLQSLVAESPYIGRTTIVVNRQTDVGAALVDQLEDRGLAPVQATMTGGGESTGGDPDEAGVHVDQHDAVDTLATLYRDGRMDFPGAASEDTSRLARGIQSFIELTDNKGSTDAGPASDGAQPQRQKVFDTHVTSAALAAWLGTERSFDPTQHLKKDPHTEPSTPDGR
jgi:hypothetical protein